MRHWVICCKSDPRHLVIDVKVRKEIYCVEICVDFHLVWSSFLRLSFRRKRSVMMSVYGQLN